jgi:phosphoglycerate dehydrogenase-like enzyme
VNALRALGCELVLGDRAWQQPRGAHEDAVVEAARGAVALMGTSMRHTPITRRIMQASQRLRVVAKYTVGVDDNDTEAATDLGIMVCGIPDNVYNRDVIPRWRERFGGASIAAA